MLHRAAFLVEKAVGCPIDESQAPYTCIRYPCPHRPALPKPRFVRVLVVAWAKGANLDANATDRPKSLACIGSGRARPVALGHHLVELPCSLSADGRSIPEKANWIRRY